MANVIKFWEVQMRTHRMGNMDENVNWGILYYVEPQKERA